MATGPTPQQRPTPRTMLVSGVLAVATALVVGSWPDPGALRPPAGPQLVVASAGPRSPAAPGLPEPPRLAPDVSEPPPGQDPGALNATAPDLGVLKPTAPDPGVQAGGAPRGTAIALPAPPGQPTWPSVGSGRAYERPTTSRAAPAYVPSSAGVTPDGYHRSLVYSGLIGLAIATTGLAMVGRRRRLW
jgi:hypothetical protein